MTSNITQEERDEQVDDIIKCTVCLDYFDDPRVLPCSHTFCMKCIKQIADSRNGSFMCPFRDGKLIQQIQPNTLPKNQTVGDIVEIMLKNKVTVQCFNCDIHAAVVWCRDCQNKGFCSECYSNLHKQPALRDHRPCEPKPPKIYNCPNHSTRELEYWCPTNKRIYCSNCLADKQDSHKCELVSDAIKTIADRVQQSLKTHPLAINPKSEIDKMYVEYETTSKAKRLTIAQQYESMHKMLDDHQKTTNESLGKIDERNIDAIKDYEVRVLGVWRRLHENQTLFKQRLKTGEYVEVLENYEKHEEYLRETNKQWTELKPPNMADYNILGLNDVRMHLQQSLEKARVIEQPHYENSQLEQILAQEEKSSVLNLNNKKLNDFDMSLVAQALRTNQTFTIVYLGGNQIKAVGAKYIADSLRHNMTLTTLDLWNNRIGIDGVQHIAEILRRTTTITSLGLNTNEIKDQGAQYLADALRNNTILIDLFVADNGIGDVGAQSFIDALKNNRTLKKVQIFQSNEISVAFKAQLEKQDNRLI